MEFFKETQLMPRMVLTPDSVMKTLESQSLYKTAGPDELHLKVMWAPALFIAELLTELFNLSLLATEIL